MFKYSRELVGGCNLTGITHHQQLYQNVLYTSYALTHIHFFAFVLFNISGYIGAGSCMILANFGSAWGTWQAGVGVCKMGIDYPKGVIKNIVPIVMAGVLGIYGLIVAVILTQSITSPAADGTTRYSMYNGYAHMAAGLCCGISCLAAGGTIGGK